MCAHARVCILQDQHGTWHNLVTFLYHRCRRANERCLGLRTDDAFTIPGCTLLSGRQGREMADVLEDASFSLTTAKVISSAPWPGFSSTTQLDFRNATISLFSERIPCSRRSDTFILSGVINIYAQEHQKSFFWMPSHFYSVLAFGLICLFRKYCVYLHALLTLFCIANGSAAAVTWEP